MMLSGFTAIMVCDIDSNRSILVKLSDGREIWIPRKIIETCDLCNKSSNNMIEPKYFIEIPQWFARKERISAIDRRL